MKHPAVIKALFWAVFILIGVLLMVGRKPLFDVPYSTVITDAHGQLLGARTAADGQWRFPQTEEVPFKFVQCITTFEDRRFFWHNGVDVAAVVSALYGNVVRGGRTRGASTLTMQVMRLSRGATRRNWYSKLAETLGALRLEMGMSKPEILAAYAAHAPFGGNVVGLEAAAWRYFGRPAASLSWGEMSSLAVLPNAPSLVHPGRNRSTLRAKRDGLLQQLHVRGILDDQELQLAMLEPIPGKPLPLPQDAPHLLQYVKLHAKRGQPGQTTIDQKLQQAANEILVNRHGALLANGIRNAAMLVVEVETGNVVVYAGNVYDPQRPELQSSVDIIQAPRSPGSVLKPILYAAAMSAGELLPHALLPDIPVRIGGYAPENFDRSYDGAVPASEAIARSLNVPAVVLLRKYKYPRFYELLKKTGITTFQHGAGHYGLSMILGGSEVSMWDLAGVYTGMARTVNLASKNRGRALESDFKQVHIFPDRPHKPAPKVLHGLDATSSWFALEAMRDVMRPGEEGLWQQFESSQAISWKTGTSFGFRDGWAVGVTPKYVVVVWAGNANGEGRPGLTGVQTAAPILFDMFKILPKSGAFRRPAVQTTFLPVCRRSGMRATLDCHPVDTLYMPAAGIHSPQCPYHKTIHLNAGENYQVSAACVPAEAIVHKKWFVLPPSIEWYYRQRHPEYIPLPPILPGCGPEAPDIALIYPTAGARIYIPKEMGGNRGSVIFRAAKRSAGKLFWHIDGTFAGETSGFHELSVSPPAGRHVLTLITENGERLQQVFTVVNN